MTFWTRTIMVLIMVLVFANCGAIQDQSKQLPTTIWQTERCDTTQRITHFSAFDLALPFTQTDTLTPQLTEVPHLFMVVLDKQQLTSWAVVSAASFKGRPSTWQLANLPDSLATSKVALQTLDSEYLWSLVGQPDYPYDRYQMLLQATRDSFLTKRAAILVDYQRDFPKYALRVQSDLRGAGFQRQYLAMGKSVSPLGQHQFGLASDIGIHYRGKQLQNMAHYKTFLNDIGGRYGLTWGGNFKGFVDSNHVQYFLNSSELLRRFPELRFEFEPFAKYFKNRVKRMTAAGKEAKVEDTKALLATLHSLHFNTPCTCDTLAQRPTSKRVLAIQKQMKTAGYVARRDLMVVGDLDAQTATLLHPTGLVRTLRMGVWK
ncbi:MAG: M15 family peptidase [Runella slithyformis]|nr:MAG: M15 family peptidase [Runella slithyformis]